ncbi:MAG: hypothetical protein QOJ40_2116 [Verrucomicrobiota bacterium]
MQNPPRKAPSALSCHNFSSFFACWLWRTIYLSKLPGLDKKVRVAFDWTLDLLFHKDVCAVHDLPPRADFYRREHRKAAVGDNGQHSSQVYENGVYVRAEPGMSSGRDLAKMAHHRDATPTIF